MSGESGKIQSMVSVRYGERVVRKSDVFYDYSSYGEPDGDLHMDYNFWVMRSGDKVILMDTGYDIAAHDWLGEISVMPTPEALKLIGLDPLAVDMVITSHFHYDHIGYLGLFENAQVISGQAEYDYWFGKRDANALEGEFTTAENLVPVEKAQKEGRLRLISEPTEVLPGITVYQVGGHCPGEVIALIETESGPFILASDAAHFYEQLENEWPFFAFTNLDEMRNALAFILKLAKETGATVIPGHDGRTRQRFPAAPGAAGSISTVLV
jgi:glyoxylase-like metal-dependent hydrolase (beta-lactamase superfamily II)